MEPLARHFLAKFSRRMKKQVDTISADALALLTQYHWPGNIRELENIIERGVILARGSRLTADLLPISRCDTVPSALSGEGKDSLESVECSHIGWILKKTGYHKTRSAEILGVTRKTLDRKIAEYALTIPKSGAEG